jgi:hypothetical protein
MIPRTAFSDALQPNKADGLLAYMVDQELLFRNEYLAAENRILKAQLQRRARLSDTERMTLGEIRHRLGRKALSEVAVC